MNPQLKKILDSIPKINPRMEELALQADCTIDLMGYGEGNVEEFAKLIIRECASVVNYYHSRNETVTPRQILQHFGVKE
jgi:hypothetical protein